MIFLEFFAPLVSWLIRLSLAVTFLYHGLPKFQGAEGFSALFGFPVYVTYLIGIGEVGGAAGLVLGGLGMDKLTRLSGAVLATIMAGTIYYVHWGIWDMMRGGMEFNVLILLISLSFVTLGNRAFKKR